MLRRATENGGLDKVQKDVFERYLEDTMGQEKKRMPKDTQVDLRDMYRKALWDKSKQKEHA